MSNHVRNFSSWIIGDMKTHLKSGPHLRVVAYILDVEEAFPLCQLALTLTGKFISPLALETTSLGF